VNVAGFGGNWSLGRVPLATDDVLFTLPFVPPQPAFNTGSLPFQPLANGATVVLFPGSSFPPALVANSLSFMGNYTLVTAAATFNAFPSEPGVPYHVEALTLTSGRVNVGAGFRATMNVPLASETGSIVKTGPGTLIINQPQINSAALPPILALNPFAGNYLPPQPTLDFLPAVQGNLVIQQGTVGGNFVVSGNLTAQSGGALSMEIVAPNIYERKIVWGTASLNGGLDVLLLPGFRPKKGEKFTVLSAYEVSGQFKQVDAPVFDLLTLRPFYSKNAVTLEVVVNSFAALPGLNRNQATVGRELDAVMNDPRAAQVINYLYDQSLSELPKDLERLSPDQLTSVFTTSIAYAQQQSLNLQRRTDDIRSGSTGFSAANLAINGVNPSYSGGFGVAGPNGYDGKEVKETKEVAPAENRWGAFVSGTGEWVNVTGTDQAHGYGITSGGFTLGVDYKVCPNFAIGLAAGYTGTTADLTDHGRVWINGGKLGIYGTFYQNNPAPAAAPATSKDSKEAAAPAPSVGGGFYADFAAFGGYNGYDTRRSALEGDARGSTHGGEVDALFGAGYDFQKGNLTFGPTASFNYTYAGVNGFTEHNSLAPLNIHGGDADSLRTAFGFKISYDWKVGGIILKPEFRAAWQHEFGDDVYSLNSSFANGAGGSFGVSGPKIGRDSALIGAGVAIQLNERCTTYFYYDGDLGRRNYESNSVTGGFRITF
jgi:outer membrane autotransporter protein